MGEWYYIGHYGQLGPLTREQIDELIEGGVITPETYVWKSGMAQWLLAEGVNELRDAFRASAPYHAPPPPPMPSMEPRPFAQTPRPQVPPVASNPRPYPVDPFQTQVSSFYSGLAPVRSDKSRTVGGVLNLIIPGAGRFYLGYYAYGVLQFALCVCTIGILFLWSFIDGILILSGGVKFDGFGRVLND